MGWRSQVLDDAGVSAREAEILAALGEHLTNAEIASRLYISVRTVESHVSSLLRKLGVSDRRALAQVASQLADPTMASGGAPLGGAPAPLVTGTGTGGSPGAVHTTVPGRVVARQPVVPPQPFVGEDAAPLPSPLTSFVGRAHERAALAAALTENRLVTAVGPGGVGKTRLALAVAGDVADRYEGGVWYVDLVPVTDAAMVAPSVASVLAIGGSSSRSASEMVEMVLADREALLILDNCEHLVDGTAVFVERLLARCPRVVVLTTSRARLMVPFERVFPVPGLSLSPDRPPGDRPAGDRPTGDSAAPDTATGQAGDEPASRIGDAESLFLARAAAVGSQVTGEDDHRRVTGICRALDGMALAIELAAARLPTLGLDGLEAGLADRLRLLAGGPRLDERHQSLRATLDWSYALADPIDRAVLRRVAVFAAPFTVDAAEAVVGFGPVPAAGPGEAITDALGRLAEESLVVAIPDRQGTRYRVLESIRQYGIARLADAAEEDAVRDRHLRWCAAVAADLAASPAADGALSDDDVWRDAFDAVAPECRAAARWATDRGDRRSDAHQLAIVLGDLTHRRGLFREAQHRYEDAATLTDGRAAAAALHQAAGAAATRQAGDEAIALYRAAADAALAAGDRVAAARDLVALATLANRGPGIISDLPPPVEVGELLAEARTLAGDRPEVEAAITVAQVFDMAECSDDARALARHAVDLAAAAGDPLLESGALDALTAVQLARADHDQAMATTRRRLDLLAPLQPCVDGGFELIDAYHMATEAHLAAGDLHSAHRFANQARRLPAFREGHLGALRLLAVDALSGTWDTVPVDSDRLREDWERVGRPPVGCLASGAGAVAMVHGMRGDEVARGEWLDIATCLRESLSCYSRGPNVWAPTLDVHVLLHQGRFDEAVSRLALTPDDLTNWYTGVWRQWYAAMWAEAAVLAGTADAAERIARARRVVAGNPVATALVDRAAALADRDRSPLVAVARQLQAAGCHYQRARTQVLAGGPEREAGDAALADLGTIPMAVPAGFG